MSKFLEKIKSFGLEIKLTLTAIIGFLGVILFFFVRQKVKAKQHLDYELSKIEYEKELIKLEADETLKKEKLNVLSEKEDEIRKKISILIDLESKEQREISLDELDNFFDSRGF